MGRCCRYLFIENIFLKLCDDNLKAISCMSTPILKENVKCWKNTLKSEEISHFYPVFLYIWGFLLRFHWEETTVFWFHEFDFLSMGHLFGGALKCIFFGIPELEWFSIGSLPVFIFVMMTHT